MEEIQEKLFASTEHAVIETRERKTKKVTLRTTASTYEQIEKLAEANNCSISDITDRMLKMHLEENIRLPFEKARYLHTYGDERAEHILEFERTLPPIYRQFTNAHKKYPDAPKLYPIEREAIERVMEREKPYRDKAIRNLEAMKEMIKTTESPIHTPAMREGYIDEIDRRLKYLRQLDIESHNDGGEVTNE